MRIAIVGAGVSGLVAAHLLQQRHDVTVFEAGSYAGGHTNTIRVDTEYETHYVDTGFIVFNDRNYPGFESLVRKLGVAWQPSTMSFSVSDEAGDFEYNSASPNGLFAKRSHLAKPWFHRMLLDLSRFNRAARELVAGREGDGQLGTGREAGPSLGQWLEEHRFSRAFIERLIVPQAAAVWSADPGQMWSFPAKFLAEFFDNHGMLSLRGRPQWRTITGGSARYVEALIAPFRDRVRLAAPVVAVSRESEHIEVTVRGQAPERFDHIVLATHSDQALRMLADASDAERAILSAIPYRPNEAVLHTDRRLLPRRRNAWASWNYHLLDQGTPSPTVTYHMNRLQQLRSAHQFCVTLNRTEAIDPEKVIRTIQYAHPVFTPEGARAQARIEEISGVNRTSFCGAYWRWGFHEDGVQSAFRVARALGAAS